MSGVSELRDPQLKLRAPPDLEDAHAAWGANCGPATLAAALALTLEDVKPLVCNYKRTAHGPDELAYRGLMNATDMRDALQRSARDFWVLVKETREIERTMMGPAGHVVCMNPHTMIFLLAWDGPWRTVPRAAATYRHWIAYVHGYLGTMGPGFVYDVNVGWVPYDFWDETIRPQLIPKRGTGDWSISWAASLPGAT